MLKRIQFIFPLIFLASAILSAQEIIRVSDQFYAPGRLITLNNKMYFVARDSAGINIWQYDGIDQPHRYTDFNNTDSVVPTLSYAVEFQNKIYFYLHDIHSESELWRFDGINPPEQITAQSGSLAEPFFFTVAGNMLYFNADDHIHGLELWVYDGINPPHMVADILSGDGEHGISSNPYYHTALGNKICFVAEDGVHGNELWEYDGVNPPRIIKDINAGPVGSYIYYLLVLNDKLYFTADDGIHGRELWMYDGTHDPSMVYDLYPGSTSSNPNSLTCFNGKLYFNAEDSLHGKRLWSYDEINQPSLVSESYVGTSDYNQASMIVFNDKLYLSGRGASENGELWEYDGKTNPVRLTDFGPGLSYDTRPKNLTLNANRLYFTVGLKLWSFDGIHQPVPLVTLNYNSQPSHAAFEPDLFSMNNKLYMISFDPEKKEGLYVLCSLDTGVTQEQSVLISNDSIDAHQWIDCDNENIPIQGETGRIFTAVKSGHYAVILSNGECIDTSAVYEVIVTMPTSLAENNFRSNIVLYPNPSEGNISIDMGKEYADLAVLITGSDGRIVYSDILKQAKVIRLALPGHAGIYLVEVTSGRERAVFRVVKK